MTTRAGKAVGNHFDPDVFWLTPPKLMRELEQEFHFDFDACPFPKQSWNGLAVDWGQRTYCNPPYLPRGTIEKWVKKARIEQRKGKHIVMLLPAYTDRQWFHDLYNDAHTDIRFLKGRAKFTTTDGRLQRTSARFAWMIAILNPRSSSMPDSLKDGEG